jgi:hypothetical protein
VRLTEIDDTSNPASYYALAMDVNSHRFGYILPLLRLSVGGFGVGEIHPICALFKGVLEPKGYVVKHSTVEQSLGEILHQVDVAYGLASRK